MPSYEFPSYIRLAAYMGNIYKYKLENFIKGVEEKLKKITGWFIVLLGWCFADGGLCWGGDGENSK